MEPQEPVPVRLFRHPPPVATAGGAIRLLGAEPVSDAPTSLTVIDAEFSASKAACLTDHARHDEVRTGIFVATVGTSGCVGRDALPAVRTTDQKPHAIEQPSADLRFDLAGAQDRSAGPRYQ
jgi:hypothetical protein